MELLHDRFSYPQRNHFLEVLFAGLKEVDFCTVLFDQDPCTIYGLEVEFEDVQKVMERVGRSLDALDVRFVRQADAPEELRSSFWRSAQRLSGQSCTRT